MEVRRIALLPVPGDGSRCCDKVGQGQGEQESVRGASVPMGAVGAEGKLWRSDVVLKEG